jgi:TRAP-type C4-dicarboxylate transport system permease small subunit
MNRSWVVRVVEGWAIAGGFFTLAIVLVTTTNIALFALDRIARTFGGVVSGLPGYEDFVSLVVSCAALMFIPLCQLRRGHIAIDVFTERLSKRSQHTLDRIWSAAIGLLALFLAFWMFQGMAESRSDNALSPVIGWPIWPFYIPGVLSLLLWAFVAAFQAMERPVDGRS